MELILEDTEMKDSEKTKVNRNEQEQKVEEGTRMRKSREVLKKAIAKCLKVFELSRFQVYFGEAFKKKPQLFMQLHSQIPSFLEQSILTEFETLCKRNKIDFHLNRLDLLEKKLKGQNSDQDAQTVKKLLGLGISPSETSLQSLELIIQYKQKEKEKLAKVAALLQEELNNINRVCQEQKKRQSASITKVENKVKVLKESLNHLQRWDQSEAKTWILHYFPDNK